MIVALVPDDMGPMDYGRVDTQEGDRERHGAVLGNDPFLTPYIILTTAVHDTDVKRVVKCFREPNGSFVFIKMGVRISLERDMKLFECQPL